MKRKFLTVAMLVTMMAVATACGDDEAGKTNNKKQEQYKGEEIPKGGKYVVKKTKKTLKAGTNMPEKPGTGDTFTYGDYIYTMGSDGWAVKVKVEDFATRTTFGEIEETVGGAPVLDLSELFKGCGAMTESPVLPSTAVILTKAFEGCTSLKTAPVLPESVTNMQYAFSECKSLVKAPTIPDSVTSLTYTFNKCEALTEIPILPASVTNLQYTFNGCKSLVKAPAIPENVKSLNHTFSDCTSLTEAPVIPGKVMDMAGTFMNCSSLTTAPVIPESVKYVADTFNSCTSLTGQVEFNCNPTERAACFRNVDFKKQNLELTGTSNALDRLMQTGIYE